MPRCYPQSLWKRDRNLSGLHGGGRNAGPDSGRNAGSDSERNAGSDSERNAGSCFLESVHCRNSLFLTLKFHMEKDGKGWSEYGRKVMKNVEIWLQNAQKKAKI